MPLNVPDGQRCFLDANILYYCFVDVPPFSGACRSLLQRVQNGDLAAFADSRSLSDCVHKAMLAEVSQRFDRPREKLIGWLKQHPEALADLPRTKEICDRLLQVRMNILPIEPGMLPSAVAVVESEKLLLGDANIVVQMRTNDVTHLATNDDDFDRVPGITVWKPRCSSRCVLAVGPGVYIWGWITIRNRRTSASIAAAAVAPLAPARDNSC
jgi:predicted nucleic acid-binding protein